MQSHWLCNSAGELFAEVPVQFPQLNSQVTQHCTFLLKTTAGKKSNITGLGEGGIALKSQQSLLLQNLIKGWRTLWLPLEHADIRHKRDSWYYLYHTPTTPPTPCQGWPKASYERFAGEQGGDRRPTGTLRELQVRHRKLFSQRSALQTSRCSITTPPSHQQPPGHHASPAGQTSGQNTPIYFHQHKMATSTSSGRAAGFFFIFFFLFP